MYLQSVPIHLFSFSISHFLNCFLTILSSPITDYSFDELSYFTSQSTNNTSNSTLSNSTNITSQRTNSKKKSKKQQQQQQRRNNPNIRNGKNFKIIFRIYRKENSSFRIIGLYIIDIEGTLVTISK